MRGPVIVVAGNTFREVGRDRMLHLMGALITGFVLFGWVLGWLNPEERDQTRHLIDFGLGAVNLFGLLMAVFLGASLLRREMERRTLYTVLCREVTRGQFVVGKFLGLVAVFATGLGIVALIMLLYFAVFGATPGLPLLAAIYGNLLELAVLTAVSLLFGAFSTPAISAMATVTFWFTGHATETLIEYIEQPGRDALELPFRAIYYSIPNLTNFNFRASAAHGVAVDATTLLAATAYAAVWCAALVGLSSLLFRRRELP